jgi:hypothetical protein
VSAADNRRFAAKTVVAVERTQAEISALLARHGATARAVGVDDVTGRATVMFALAGRKMRVDVALHPDRPAAGTPRGWQRWRDEERRRWIATQRDQQERSAWRGILLLLRAKLEAIEGGYSTVEHEFLADVVLPSGERVGEMVSSVVEQAYLTGMLPPLLSEASP